MSRGGYVIATVMLGLLGWLASPVTWTLAEVARHHWYFAFVGLIYAPAVDLIARIRIAPKDEK